MSTDTLSNRITEFTRGRLYHDATLQRWLKLSPTEGEALLMLAEDLRLGENQLRDLWLWLDEIADRDGTDMVAVLKLQPLAAISSRSIGRAEKLKLFKTALRILRFPQLAAVEAQAHAAIQAMQLPRNIRTVLPPGLEGDGVHIEIDASSPAALREAATRLLAAAESPACVLLFDLLDQA